MHIFTARRQKISLTPLPVQEIPAAPGYAPEFAVSGAEDSSRLSELVSTAGRMMFEMEGPRLKRARRSRPLKAAPAVFREELSGCLRCVYKEIMVRFQPGAKAAIRRKLLQKHGFTVRKTNRYVDGQHIVHHPQSKFLGGDLIEVANDWAEADEVMFATPNFVSEFRRNALPTIHPEQWHLWNRAKFPGQKKGEDVDARGAWRTTTGRARVTVAVIDDGVDVDHANLKGRIARNPDADDPDDKLGRDFFVPDESPDHYDPRPKVFAYPYHHLQGNDIHGTPCAGVIAAAGTLANVRGVASGCRILPVKIFHADAMASDARVADAIRYAASIADVLSCSWSGPWSPDIEMAVQDAAAGRDGKGAAVFCAAGNGGGRPVGFPAALPEAIAVGASTDQARLAGYSNVGPEISVVAPSSGGKRGIYNTDVSYPNRGFNVGTAAAGGADGLHTNDFGGTSSATPLAAGIAALVLSVNPDLTRDELRDLLQRTADKIGSGYNANGHSRRFGYGRVNAAEAVKEAAAMRQPRRRASAKPGSTKRSRAAPKKAKRKGSKS